MAIEFAQKQLPLIEMSPEQIATLRDGLARLVGEREAEVVLKKASMEEFKERIDELDERISEVARLLREQEGE